MAQTMISLTGNLTFSTVMDIWKTNKVALKNARDISIDLKNVDYCDSSSLALFIEWQRLAEHHNKTISFINPPEQLIKIAQVAHLDQILKFET